MGFTVYHAGKISDWDFESYIRLLRQSGLDIGKLPRVPEPGTGRRWLHFWDTREAAQAFADELKQNTGDEAWQVAEVDDTPSVGPMGPILVQMGLKPHELFFAMAHLSEVLLRSALPQAVPRASYLSLDRDDWIVYQQKRGNLADLVRDVLPVLTGATIEELNELGYVAVEQYEERTLVSVPPGDLSRDRNGDPHPPTSPASPAGASSAATGDM